MCSKLKIVEINDFSGFLDLKEEWNDVLSRCDHSIFSTWEWLTCWWKHYGTGRKLLLLLAEEDNQIFGIAPLMYAVHKMLGLRMEKIEFLGTPDSDYSDFVVENGKEKCILLFMDYLNEMTEKWNCIDLVDIPQDSKSLPLLKGISHALKPIRKCPYVPLPKSYDTFLYTLRRKQRKELGRNLRRLEESFEVEFSDFSGTGCYVDGMNMLFRLHQKRWESRGLPGVFADKRNRDFHLAIARSFSRKNWLGLYVLKLSNKPVAALYGFRYMSKYYAYLSGFDPEYFKHGVGSLLFSYTINESIREGSVGFDFMRGGEEYKDRWNTMTRWNHEAIIPHRGFLENVEYQLCSVYWRQAERLKYIVKNAPRTLARAINKYS
jgi:CelD/BcsL family acetyltransferase involved in cellulose biosynthesis